MRSYITLSEGGDRASVDDCCYRGETSSGMPQIVFTFPFCNHSL